MKKLFYITIIGLVGFVGFTWADITTLHVTPTTQSAISGSSVTFTVTGTSTTGTMYLKYVLPQSAQYMLMYQSANITPINNGYINPLNPDPIFSISANSNFSVTITAKLITTARGFSPINTIATFGTDQRVSTILTSAIAQITPIGDLMITNILTGDNPSFSGDMVSYYITLQNIGSDDATGISFMSNYPITMFAYPNGTFNGAPQTYNYIDYLLHYFVWTGNYLNILNPGQLMTIILDAPMTQNFAVGATFNQIAKVVSTSPEYTTGNNLATATGIVQAPANVWITKTLATFTGYNVGDQVIYTITYGNSGGKPAYDVTLTDVAPVGITLPATTFTVGTLPAGSGGTIVLTGTFSSLFMSGYTFVNTANISTTSIESATGNNSAIATGIVKGMANVTLDIIANNLTTPQFDNIPYGSGPNILIQALSGDIVQLTITYANFGNTTGANAVIGLSGTQGFVTLGTYNSNIGTLVLNTTGTIVVTGIVGPRNYISFTPTARLSYNSGQLLTDSVIIQEPLVCGDGLLTRNEPCDTNGNLGVLYSGQVCENQQGVCVLVTQSIINNACINYQYSNQLGGIVTGQACDDAIVPLTNATCTTMTGSAPTTITSGYSINFTCKGNNTNITTPIVIDCGNGTTVSGTGALLNGTCSYLSSFVGNAQCKVGNDIANVACRVPVSVNAGQCGALDALDGTVALVDDNGDAESTFRCETVNHVTAQTITIDCGNGEHHSTTNASVFEAGCEYTNVHTPRTYDVQCLVDGVSAPTCQESLIVDEAKLGYCGDGIREGYEDCDDGDDNGTPSSECSKGCDLETSSMVGCFNVGDTNLSIQEGEILPFRWTLDNTDNIIPGSTCTDKPDGKIPEDTLYCTFDIYNGTHTEADGDPIYSIRKKCNDDNRNSLALFDYLRTKGANRWSLQHAFGKYYIDAKDFVDGTYGEYKISLDKVEYQYCRSDDKNEGTEIDRVCNVNFTVTKPYIVQKSSFGLTPKATNNVDLNGFLGLDGTKIVTSTELDKIMIIDANDYKGGNTIVTMMDSFITKFSKLAVKYKTITSEEGNDITVSKVPGKDIIVFKGNGTLMYTDGSTKMKPFTVIVDGPSIKINGSIENANAMFLVNKGNITFLPSANACEKTQVVKGIFVTKNKFIAADTIINNDLNKKRCEYGGLKIQGILIGNGIDDLVQSRRSQLNHRFRIVGTTEAAIKAERRNEIFNGAALLIEYSPSLWSALPPGASEFTKALDVYKK